MKKQLRIKYHKRPKAYEVQWIDAMMYSRSWYDREDIIPNVKDNQRPMRTIGFIFAETEQLILMCKTSSPDGQYGGVFTIPKGGSGLLWFC